MVKNTNDNSDIGEPHQQRPHKIPVPTNYRSAAKILRLVVEERRNVKTLVLQDKHFRKGKGLAIMDLILVNLKQIDDLIIKTELTQKEPKLNPWLARVLIAELLFGRGELKGESLPVQCIRRYHESLKDALSKSDVTPAKQLDFKEALRPTERFEKKMGKRAKNKLSLNSGEEQSDASLRSAEGTSNDKATETMTDDRFEIPLHSKQAAFALLWLLVYSFGMFTLPFGAFYGTKHILTHNFHVEGFANTCGSVLAAVLTVNIIIVLYAIRGYQEAEEDEKEAKKHQSEQLEESKKCQ